MAGDVRELSRSIAAPSRRRALLGIAGGLVIVGAIAGVSLYVWWDQAVPVVGMGINFVRSLTAPKGTTTTELAAVVPGADAGPALAPVPVAAATGDWPSYNKTLTSERYSALAQINRANAAC